MRTPAIPGALAMVLVSCGGLVASAEDLSSGGGGDASDESSAYDAGVGTSEAHGGDSDQLYVSADSCQPLHLAVHGSYLYWTSQCEYGADFLMRANLSGGDVSTIASGGSYGRMTLILDDTSAYWATSSWIMRTPISGGDSTHFAAAEGNSTDLAQDDSSVYWSTPSQLMRQPKSGGTSVLLWQAGADAICSLAVSGDDVYWVTSTGSLRKIARSGGVEPVLLASGGTVGSTSNVLTPLVVDNQNAYWRTPRGAVVQAPIRGGAVSTIAHGGVESRDPEMLLNDDVLYLAGFCGGPSCYYDGIFTISIPSASMLPRLITARTLNLLIHGSVLDGAFAYWSASIPQTGADGKGTFRGIFRTSIQ